MDRLPLYERQALFNRSASTLGNLSILLSVAALLPEILFLLNALFYVFAFIYWFLMIALLIIIVLFPTICTVGFCWIDEGFRNFVGGFTSAFDVTIVGEKLTESISVVVSAYRVFCPVFSAAAMAVGAVAIVMGLRVMNVSGKKSAFVCGIVGITLGVIAIIMYYALIPFLMEAAHII